MCVSNSARQLDEYIRARQWTKSTASGIPLMIQCLLSEITWIFGNLKSQSSATSSWLSTGLTQTRLSIKNISTFLKKKTHLQNTSFHINIRFIWADLPHYSVLSPGCRYKPDTSPVRVVMAGSRHLPDYASSRRIATHWIPFWDVFVSILWI